MKRLHTRRDFTNLAMATAANMAISQALPFARGVQTASSSESLDPYFGFNVLHRHYVPKDLRPANINAVVDALTTNDKLPLANHLQQFVDWLQYVHHSLTGMTYPEHMEKAYGFRSPIEILAVENPGLDGEFHHETPEIRRNLIYINSSLNPRRLMQISCHELEHSVHGRSELFAHANTLMAFAYMFAHFPELLAEDPSKCLFNDTITYYAGKLTIKEGELAFSHDPEIVPVIFLFGSLEYTGHTLNFEEAFQMLADNSTLESKIGESVQERIKNQQFEDLIDARSCFLDEIQSYILRQNPDMPPNKVDLLKGKLAAIREGEKI